MCGIAGAVDESGAALDRDVLLRMSASMRTRGPDDAGEWGEGACRLVFRRLSIIDLSGGHQPMTTADGAAVIVFNGEIYNFQELRSRLTKLGHHFRTHSDTETILYAYRQWGVDCVRELDGMFALALWDSREQRLLLARDRFGKKPLYYYCDGRALIFASTLSALLCHPLVPRMLDAEALAEYLALEYVVAPRTMIAGVHKLPAASLLLFSSGSVQRTEQYWRPPPMGTLRIGLPEAEARLHGLLSRAVEKRLLADVPLGVFLSGGLDSSTVTALATAQRRGIRTFSVRFSDPSFDESDWARKVASHLGTQHHEEDLSPAAAQAIVPMLGSILDEPVADASIVPTFLLSRFARRHVTVALGGDGGDELFAGYPTYVAHRLANICGERLHPPLLAALRALAARLPVSHDNFSFDFKLKQFLGGLDAPPDERNYVWMGACERARVAALLGRDFDVYRVARERYADSTGEHLERVFNQDLGLYLTHSVLAKVDRASMATSLEVRAPLLDRELAEFVIALPLDFKLRRLTGKYLLKRVARRLLPAEVVNRPKKGFGMPVASWLRGPLEPLAREMLFDSLSMTAAGMIRRDEVQRLVDEHLMGVADHRKRLWTLLVLELWRRAQGIGDLSASASR
jgi:asparagine synthase (glutamine-hydrolysing)